MKGAWASLNLSHRILQPKTTRPLVSSARSFVYGKRGQAPTQEVQRMKDEPNAYQSANLFRLIAEIVIKTSLAAVYAFAFLITEEDFLPVFTMHFPRLWAARDQFWWLVRMELICP